MLISKWEGFLFAVAVALYALPALAAEPVTPVFWAEIQPEKSKHTEKIQQALLTPLSSKGLEFTDTPLEQVVDFLRDEYKLEIQLDQIALDDLGINPDEPVSVNLRNISLGASLRIMLRQLDLTYLISDELLLITSEEEALSRMTVAVYPVGDLLVAKTDDPASSKLKPEGIDTLIDVIISAVASDTWVENGGPEAEIRPIQPGLLVVAQTQDVHQQIQGLLRALRQAKQHSFAVPYYGIESSDRGMGGGTFCGGHSPANRPTPSSSQQPTDAPRPPAHHHGGGMF